ncbi:PilZ domain-containing protein [Sphingopyxis sp.]|uniref:PilZ domain-containing protein n=1 Tax=Sphingopyxis sp. TaxID=1908224 RepID=UPI002ED9EFC8
MGNRTLEASQAPTSARRDERTPVDGRARFREAGSNPFDAELFDLSANGFRMFTFSRQAIGKHIWVNLPGLQPVEAVVRRQDGNNYGCEFVNPLHPSVADHLKAKLAK